MPRMSEDYGTRMMGYECPAIMEPLVEALRKQCSDGERVIWRCAFRWKDDSGVLSNQYEMFDLETVAENIGCEIVWDFNHAAIIRARTAAEENKDG